LGLRSGAVGSPTFADDAAGLGWIGDVFEGLRTDVLRSNCAVTHQLPSPLAVRHRQVEHPSFGDQFWPRKSKVRFRLWCCAEPQICI
jgi:hypothetical protein